MGRLKELLVSPSIAIRNGKREKDIIKTLEILIVTWFLFAISALLVATKVLPTFTAVGMFLLILFLGIVCSAFCGYLITVITNTLGGKGKYYGGLTTITYSSFPLSIGSLITAFLSLIHPALSAVLGFILIAVTAALSFSIYFRSIKEFFATDMITTFISFIITVYVFAVAIYGAILFSVAGLAPVLQSTNIETILRTIRPFP